MRNTTDSRSICFEGAVGRDDDKVRDVGGEHHGERSWLRVAFPAVDFLLLGTPLVSRSAPFPKAREERTSTCASSSSSSSSSWMSRHALAMALDGERLAPRSSRTKRAEI